MAIIQKADAEDIAKEYYAAGGLINAAYEKNPGLAVCKKVKITGKHYDFPIKYGYASNRSRTAATALNKVNKKDYEEFNVTTCESFDAKDIEKRAMAEVRDEGAFVDLLTDTIDDLGKALGNGVGEDLYLHRGAAIGQVGSINGAVVTLKNPSHITRFYKGQEIRSSENDGLSGSLQTGSATVIEVDRDLGTITTDGGGWVAQIATLDADDFLFNDGDFGLGRAGLADWIPDVTTGLGTAFYNATRSADKTRLAGCRSTVSAGTDITSASRTLLARIGREEGDPNIGLISFDLLADLETQIEQKQYITVQGKGVDMGFDGIRIIVGGHKVDFVPDRSIGDDRIYFGSKETLECIYSQEDVFVIDDEDGEVLARNSTSFSYDLRGCSFSNFVVRKPSDWGVLLFT